MYSQQSVEKTEKSTKVEETKGEYIEFTFATENHKGVIKKISAPYMKTQEQAEEIAVSELLEAKNKDIFELSTPLLDIFIGDALIIRGYNYIVTRTTLQAGVIKKMNIIEVMRYDYKN